MIGLVKGTVAYQAAEYCLIETAGGVGYRVFMPVSQLRTLAVGQEVKVLTYTAVREDAIQLYGFLTRQYYDLFTLLHDLTENNIDEYNEYYLNKSLLPREYDTDLFVIKKKSFWRQLLISIIGSQTILECVKFVFNDEENISILKNQKYLSEEVIGNIRFFIYEANISAGLIDNSFRIYEYGLFMKDEKKSIALLFFYSFNIVTNIHKI